MASLPPHMPPSPMTIPRLVRTIALRNFSQVAFAPVKQFSRQLLDDEVSQHKDGVREVVKMIKKIGESLGLRRKVEKSDGNLAEKPTFMTRALDTLVAGFEKHAEF